jgi:hypothetical protein
MHYAKSGSEHAGMRVSDVGPEHYEVQIGLFECGESTSNVGLDHFKAQIRRLSHRNASARCVSVSIIATLKSDCLTLLISVSDTVLDHCDVEPLCSHVVISVPDVGRHTCVKFEADCLNAVIRVSYVAHSHCEAGNERDEQTRKHAPAFRMLSNENHDWFKNTSTFVERQSCLVDTDD